jgi:DNA-binding CsgD family transcriptional regulator
MSHREIAAALDISPSTVEGQLAIAMRRLKAAAAPFLKKI